MGVTFLSRDMGAKYGEIVNTKTITAGFVALLMIIMALAPTTMNVDNLNETDSAGWNSGSSIGDGNDDGLYLVTDDDDICAIVNSTMEEAVDDCFHYEINEVTDSNGSLHYIFTMGLQVFNCGDGYEILWRYVGDGSEDCNDGSDESTLNPLYSWYCQSPYFSITNWDGSNHNEMQELAESSNEPDWCSTIGYLNPDLPDENSSFDYDYDGWMNLECSQDGDDEYCSLQSLTMDSDKYVWTTWSVESQSWLDEETCTNPEYVYWGDLTGTWNDGANNSYVYDNGTLNDTSDDVFGVGGCSIILSTAGDWEASFGQGEDETTEDYEPVCYNEYTGETYDYTEEECNGFYWDSEGAEGEGCYNPYTIANKSDYGEYECNNFFWVDSPYFPTGEYDEDWQEMMGMCDINNDSTCAWTEYIGMMEWLMSLDDEMTLSEEMESDIMDVFNLHDLDDNGIQIDEMEDFWNAMNEYFYTLEFEGMFELLDTNGDGLISADELLAAGESEEQEPAPGPPTNLTYFVGNYERLPAENSFHTVMVYYDDDDGKLWWTNAGGATWELIWVSVEEQNSSEESYCYNANKGEVEDYYEDECKGFYWDVEGPDGEGCYNDMAGAGIWSMYDYEECLSFEWITADGSDGESDGDRCGYSSSVYGVLYAPSTPYGNQTIYFSDTSMDGLCFLGEIYEWVGDSEYYGSTFDEDEAAYAFDMCDEDENDGLSLSEFVCAVDLDYESAEEYCEDGVTLPNEWNECPEDYVENDDDGMDCEGMYVNFHLVTSEFGGVNFVFDMICELSLEQSDEYRENIDLFGNGDGNINATEVTEFIQMMNTCYDDDGNEIECVDNEGYFVFYCSNDGAGYALDMGGILCPDGSGTVPTCPDGEPCECIDIDGSCEDGDDDWGYYTEEVEEEEWSINGVVMEIYKTEMTFDIDSIMGNGSIELVTEMSSQHVDLADGQNEVTVQFENFDNDNDDGCFEVRVLESGDWAPKSVSVEPATEWEISDDGGGTGYEFHGCSTPDSFTAVFEYSGDGHPNGIENLPPICEFKWFMANDTAFEEGNLVTEGLDGDVEIDLGAGSYMISVWCKDAEMDPIQVKWEAPELNLTNEYTGDGEVNGWVMFIVPPGLSEEIVIPYKWNSEEWSGNGEFHITLDSGEGDGVGDGVGDGEGDGVDIEGDGGDLPGFTNLMTITALLGAVFFLGRRESE